MLNSARIIRLCAALAVAVVSLIMWMPVRYLYGIDLEHIGLEASALIAAMLLWALAGHTQQRSGGFAGIRFDLWNTDLETFRHQLLRIIAGFVVLAALLQAGKSMVHGRDASMMKFLIDAAALLMVGGAALYLAALPMQRFLHFILDKFDYFHIFAVSTVAERAVVPPDGIRLGPLYTDMFDNYKGSELHGYGDYVRRGANAFGAWAGDRLVAACALFLPENDPQDDTWPLREGEAKLVDITTDSQFRGRGIAQALIRYSAAAMSERGVGGLYARIWHTNLPSKAAFSAAGWERIATVFEFRPLRIGPRRRLVFQRRAAIHAGAFRDARESTAWRFFRRIRDARNRHGAREFASLVAYNFLYSLRRVGFGRSSVAADPFDDAHGTETTTIREIGSLDVSSKNAKYAVRYQTCAADDIRAAILDACRDPADFTFVDFGSGKGRALIVAGEFPFKAVIGVEFSLELYQASLRNIARANLAEARARVRVHYGDASDFPLPTGNLVCYFYNPFHGPVLTRIVEKLIAHLDAGKQVSVIYIDPVHRDVFEASNRFVVTNSGPQGITLVGKPRHLERATVANAL